MHLATITAADTAKAAKAKWESKLTILRYLIQKYQFLV